MSESSSSFSSSYSIHRPQPKKAQETIKKGGREEEIQRLMTQWGVSRAGAEAMYANNKRKQAQRLKIQEKNMSAAERFQKFKNQHH